MKFTKKPVVIDAIIFNGKNYRECEEFIGIENINNALSYPNIITSEGVMRVNKGDYIIKEPFDKERKFYPCKPDIFKLTYEAENLTQSHRGDKLHISEVDNMCLESLSPEKFEMWEKVKEGLALSRGKVSK